jgi:hypothetical protein
MIKIKIDKIPGQSPGFVDQIENVWFLLLIAAFCQITANSSCRPFHDTKCAQKSEEDE